MSKPPAKRWKVILTVRDMFVSQKSPVISKKSSVLEALDVAEKVNFDEGDTHPDHGYMQCSTDIYVGDMVEEDIDGLQSSEGEEDNELSETDEDDDKPDSMMKTVALTPPPTDRKKRGCKGKKYLHFICRYISIF